METEQFRRAIKYIADDANGWGGQTALSHLYGCSNSYINMIINGAKRPSYKVQNKFAEVLNTTRNELLKLGQDKIDGKLDIRLPFQDFQATATHTPAPVIDFQDEATKKHQIVIEGFEDREWALSLNEMLVEIEKRAPELKNIVKGSIENFYKNLPEIAEAKKTGTNPNQ